MINYNLDDDYNSLDKKGVSVHLNKKELDKKGVSVHLNKKELN